MILHTTEKETAIIIAALERAIEAHVNEAAAVDHDDPDFNRLLALASKERILTEDLKDQLLVHTRATPAPQEVPDLGPELPLR